MCVCVFSKFYNSPCHDFSLDKLTLSQTISSCASRVLTDQGQFPTESLAAWMPVIPCQVDNNPALDNNPEHSQFIIIDMEIVI